MLPVSSPCQGVIFYMLMTGKLLDSHALMPPSTVGFDGLDLYTMWMAAV